MTRYMQHPLDEEGWTEWIHPAPDPGKFYRMKCCDCGLVHEMEFRVTDSAGSRILPKTPRIIFRARRNERATAASRRKRK